MLLAGEVGTLVIEQQSGRLTDNQTAVARQLVAILRLMRQAVNEAGGTLDAAAVNNLAKIFDPWPRERIFPDFAFGNVGGI